MIAVLETAGRLDTRPTHPAMADPRIARGVRASPSSTGSTTSTIEIHHSIDLPKTTSVRAGVVGRRAPDLAPPRRVVPLRQGRARGRTGRASSSAARRVPLRRRTIGHSRLSAYLEAYGHELRRCARSSSRCSASGAAAPIPATTRAADPGARPNGRCPAPRRPRVGDRRELPRRPQPRREPGHAPEPGPGRRLHVLPAHATPTCCASGCWPRSLEREHGRRRVHGRPGPATSPERSASCCSRPTSASGRSAPALLRSDYFLCPFDHEMGGYRLESSGLSGERARSTTTSQYLGRRAEPAARGRRSGASVLLAEEPWTPRTSNQAVVCTDLEEPAVDQDQDPWLKMLAAYDRIVAREVSMHGEDCRVVRPVRNGYLLVFEQAEERRAVGAAAAVRGALATTRRWCAGPKRTAPDPEPQHRARLRAGVAGPAGPRLRRNRRRHRRLHRQRRAACATASSPCPGHFAGPVREPRRQAGVPRQHPRAPRARAPRISTFLDWS